MKGLLILAVIFVGIWLWRSRSALPDKPNSASAVEPKQQNMVRCAHCGVHIPADEVVTGVHGVYCGADHLRQSES